jgi:hypothetical protein
MAARALFTTTQTARAIFSSPVIDAFVTTNTPFQAFVSTPSVNVFVTTNTPFQAFVTTFGPQQTTELTLVPAIVSQSSDCSLITFEDNTQDYPDVESGYNPVDAFSELPERAKRSEIQLWAAFEYFDLRTTSGGLELDTINLPNPSVQNNDDPWSFIFAPVTTPNNSQGGNLGEYGVYKMFLIGAPIAEDYANYVGNPNLIQIAQTTPDWFISELVFTVDCEINNCVNDARRRLVDAAMCGKCKTKEWQDKRALQVTYLYNLALANTNPITLEEKGLSNQFMFKALIIRKALEELCKDNECKCNC